jgi:flavin reductase (DIM6/NTAB) family NADH-FMN oxidoreductase RutF
VTTPRHPSGQLAEGITRAVNYPLYVVTAAAGDQRSGCLAGFITQSSIVPVRFIICISKMNHTFGVAERSTALALHLLGADQRATASIFGEETGDTVDKFAQVPWSEGATGSPLLSECAAWVEGTIISHWSAGDHEAFLISVVDGGAGTHDGQWTLRDASGFQAGHPDTD